MTKISSSRCKNLRHESFLMQSLRMCMKYINGNTAHESTNNTMNSSLVSHVKTLKHRAEAGGTAALQLALEPPTWAGSGSAESQHMCRLKRGQRSGFLWSSVLVGMSVHTVSSSCHELNTLNRKSNIFFSLYLSLFSVRKSRTSIMKTDLNQGWHLTIVSL